jgi:hypothetical protein
MKTKDIHACGCIWFLISLVMVGCGLASFIIIALKTDNFPSTWSAAHAHFAIPCGQEYSTSNAEYPMTGDCEAVPSHRLCGHAVFFVAFICFGGVLHFVSALLTYQASKNNQIVRNEWRLWFSALVSCLIASIGFAPMIGKCFTFVHCFIALLMLIFQLAEYTTRMFWVVLCIYNYHGNQEYHIRSANPRLCKRGVHFLESFSVGH